MIYGLVGPLRDCWRLSRRWGPDIQDRWGGGGGVSWSPTVFLVEGTKISIFELLLVITMGPRCSCHSRYYVWHMFGVVGVLQTGTQEFHSLGRCRVSRLRFSTVYPMACRLLYILVVLEHFHSVSSNHGAVNPGHHAHPAHQKHHLDPAHPLQMSPQARDTPRDTPTFQKS